MTPEDLKAGTAAVRKMINESGYGTFVSDAQCESMAFAVIEAVEQGSGGSSEDAAPVTTAPPPKLSFVYWLLGFLRK